MCVIERTRCAACDLWSSRTVIPMTRVYAYVHVSLQPCGCMHSVTNAHGEYKVTWTCVTVSPWELVMWDACHMICNLSPHAYSFLNSLLRWWILCSDETQLRVLTRCGFPPTELSLLTGTLRAYIHGLSDLCVCESVVDISCSFCTFEGTLNKH